MLCFVFLLPLQAHALINAHCPAWLAWLVSVIFVLLESAIIDVIFFAILVPIYQDALFDATLKARGMSRMFETRVRVNGLTLCCRGIGSGLVFVWILVLAQVKRKRSTTDRFGNFFFVWVCTIGLCAYPDCSITSYSCSWYCLGMLYQWMACMVIEGRG